MAHRSDGPASPLGCLGMCTEQCAVVEVGGQAGAGRSGQSRPLSGVGYRFDQSAPSQLLRQQTHILSTMYSFSLCSPVGQIVQGRYPDCDYTKMWLIHVIIHVVGHAGQASSTSDAGGHGGPWRQDSCHLNSAVPGGSLQILRRFSLPCLMWLRFRSLSRHLRSDPPEQSMWPAKRMTDHRSCGWCISKLTACIVE